MGTVEPEASKVTCWPVDGVLVEAVSAAVGGWPTLTWTGPETALRGPPGPA